MNDILLSKLFEYIRDNNHDLFFELEEGDKLRSWLYDKLNTVKPVMQSLMDQRLPDYAIQEQCMAEMTRELRPSRYNYLLNLLEEEFQPDYNRFYEAGILKHEVVNLIKYCKSVFDDLRFSEENEDDRFVWYAIAGTVSRYLESNRGNENVSNELQQSAEAEGQY